MIEIIGTVATVVGTLSEFFAGYIGLKVRSIKSETKEELTKDYDTKMNILESRVRENEKNISIVDDRVKAIFWQMDKINEQIVYHFEKNESAMKEAFKSLSDQCEKHNTELRGMIQELNKTKQDKKS